MSCKCYHADKNFLGEIGVCCGTKEREACSCNGDEAKCDFYDYVRKRAKKPITNVDCVRAMNDEELAMFLYKISLNVLMGTPSRGEMPDKWEDWLKQEVQE